MNNICKEIITPSEKLKKYNYCFILIIIIFIILFIIDINNFNIDKSYFNLFMSFVLLEIIITKYYHFVKILSFMILLSIINIIIYLGLFFQNNYSIQENQLLLLYIFISFFVYCLTLYVLYESYKEMKAIFLEEYENSRSSSESGFELKDKSDDNEN